MRRVLKPVGTALRAAICVRVSGKQQAADDTYGLPEQEAACRTFVGEQAWTLDEAHVYREVCSGAYIDRPQFDRLRAAIVRREVDLAVVWRFDRIGGDPGGALGTDHRRRRAERLMAEM